MPNAFQCCRNRDVDRTILDERRFVGEESYSKGTSKQYLISNEPTWCVDPLDGW